MTEFNTLADVLALGGFRPDLQGPRTRGSLTEIGLRDLDPTTPVVEFTPEVSALVVPGARYFRLEAPALQGRLGAVRFGTLTRAQLTQFSTRNDVDGTKTAEESREHGIEFFLDIDPSAADLPSVDHAVLIVGPGGPDGTLIWWTWHPGDVAGTVMARGKPTGCPIHLVGVKLHNGA